MGRVKTDDGRRVTVSARVSEGLAADVDAVRGELSRSAFTEAALRAAVARVLFPEGVAKRRGSVRCPHPGLPRSAGGFCKGCDVVLEPGGFLP